MSKRERAILATIVGLLALLAGILDPGDPTPAAIRWPLVALVAVALGMGAHICAPIVVATRSAEPSALQQNLEKSDTIQKFKVATRSAEPSALQPLPMFLPEAVSRQWQNFRHGGSCKRC